jgi:hypothetical protein
LALGTTRAKEAIMVKRIIAGLSLLDALLVGLVAYYLYALKSQTPAGLVENYPSALKPRKTPAGQFNRMQDQE